MCIEIHVCKCIRGIHTQLVSTMCVILMMQAHQWPQTIPKTLDTICGTKSYSKKALFYLRQYIETQIGSGLPY